MVWSYPSLLASKGWASNFLDPLTPVLPTPHLALLIRLLLPSHPKHLALLYRSGGLAGGSGVVSALAMFCWSGRELWRFFGWKRGFGRYGIRKSLEMG